MAKEKKVAELDNEQKKTAKKKKEKKDSKIKIAWRGFRREVKNVTWPTWKQVLKNSGMVIVIVAVCLLVIGGLDFAFNIGFEGLVNLFVGKQ